MFEMTDVSIDWILSLILFLIIIFGIIAICAVFKEKNKKRETEKRNLLSAMFAATFTMEEDETEEEYSKRIHTEVDIYLREQEDKIWNEAKEEYRNLFGKKKTCDSCSDETEAKIPCVTCVNACEERITT
ncbi:MAG: hypothetical protein M0P99_01210 [Candidatus Cloacimonetes bacterium]|nr:hypothetical protein [Candidatus Cloacimonadota bacterium]